MITDTDIKKLKIIFVTKEDLQSSTHELRRDVSELSKEIRNAVNEIIEYINATNKGTKIEF